MAGALGILFGTLQLRTHVLLDSYEYLRTELCSGLFEILSLPIRATFQWILSVLAVRILGRFWIQDSIEAVECRVSSSLGRRLAQGLFFPPILFPPTPMLAWRTSPFVIASTRDLAFCL